MKIQKVDNSLLRQFVTALARCRPFLSGAEGLLLGPDGDDGADVLPTPHARQVARWAVDHWRRFKQPPGDALRSIRAAWEERERPEDEDRIATEDYVETILEAPEPLDNHAPHLLEEFGRYLTQRRLATLSDVVKGSLDGGRVDDAIEAVQGFRTVTGNDRTGYCPALDKSALRRAFEAPTDGLIDWPSNMKWFLSRAFTRDSLIGLQAQDKVGKTFWAIDMMYWGVRSKLSVAFFQVGDLSQPQFDQRWASRVARHPLLPEHCDGNLKEPKGIQLRTSSDGKVTPEVTFGAPLHYVAPLDYGTANKARKDFNRSHMIDPRRPTVMFACHPSGTVTVRQIDRTLQRWRDELNFIPDCVAKGSLVLTDRGLLPIESIEYADKVWDGVSWVSHKGVIFKGYRRVITYQGVTATPDHHFWTEQGWRSLESCKRLRLRIIQTELGGKPVRLSGSGVSGCTSAPEREGLQTLPARSVCKMWEREVVFAGKPVAGDYQRLSGVPSTKAIPYLGIRACSGDKGEVRKSFTSRMEELWGEGHLFQVSVSGQARSIFADCVGVERNHQTSSSGSDRQRRALFARELEVVHQFSKPSTHTERNGDGPRSSVQTKIPVCDVFLPDSLFSTKQKENDTLTSEAMVETPVEEGDGEQVVAVYDIVDAGPLHRFTVSGVLAHNCIFIDYADLLAPENPKREKHERVDETWRSLRRLSQEWQACVVAPTQSNSLTYKDKKKLQKQENFSDSKGKLAHVTAMMGLSQTDYEKTMGVVRANWVVARAFPYQQAECLWVATCYPLGYALGPAARGFYK